MKLRILIYGLLILLICLLATVYLVYSNQDRLLEVARYKLADVAREKWGMEMEVGSSELSLHRNAVSFRNLSLVSEAEGLSVKIGLLEMVYSLRKLIRGEVYFEKIFLERPNVTVTLPGGGGEPPEGGWPLGRFMAGVALVGRVDVEQGALSLSVGPGDGTRLAVEGLGMQMGTSGEALATRLWAEKMTLDRGPYHGFFREVFLQGRLDGEGFSIGKLLVRGDAGPLRLKGLLTPDGSLRAEVSAEADLEALRYSLEEAIPMAGTVTAEGLLEVDSGGWRLEAQTRNRGLEIWGHPIPDVSSTVHLVPGRCTFSDIRGVPRRGSGKISGRGELNWRPGEFAYAFVADVQETRPNDVAFVRRNFGAEGFSDFGPLAGRVIIEGGTASGSAPSWSVMLDVGGPVERFFGATPVRVKGTIRSGEAGDVALKDFSVRAGDLAGSFAGTVGPGGVLDIAFLAETDSLAGSLEHLGLEWIGGKASMTGDVTGPAGNFQVTGGITAEPLTVRGVPFERAWGRLRYQEGTVALEHLSLITDGATITVDGSFETSKEKGMEAAVRLEKVPARTAASLLGAEFDVEGRLDGEVSIHGVPAVLSGNGTIESARLSVAGRVLDDARAVFLFDPGGADFSTLRAAYRDAAISFEGRVETSGRLRGSATAVARALDSFLPEAGISGGAVIEGEVEGTWPDVDFTGTAAWKNAGLAGESYPETVAEVAKRGERVTAKARLFGRFPAQAELVVQSPYPLQASLTFQDLGTSDILPALERWGPEGLKRTLAFVEGTADGGADLRIDLARPDGFSGTVRLERLEVLVANEASRLRRPAEVHFSRAGFKVERLAFEGENHRFAAGGGTESGKLSWQIDGTVDLGFLQGRFPVFEAVDLKPDISASIGGTVAAPRITGEAVLAGGRVSLAGFQTGLEAVEAEVGFDGDLVTLRRLEARVGTGSLKGSGELRLADKTMDLLLEGSVSLGEIGRQLPGIREYEGAAVFRAELSGPWNRPGYRGEVEVSDGRLRPSGLRAPLEDVSLRLSVVDEHLRVRDLSARVNGGLIKGGGYVVLPAGGEIEEVNLDLVAEKVYVSMSNTLKVISSSDLILAGTPDGYLLKGRVVLERGKYFRDMTPRPMIRLVSESREALADPGLRHPFLAELGLDIRIFAEEGFWIDNNVAQINTGLDVRVRGTPLDPVLSGEVDVREGTVYYLGKRFVLNKATFSFQERRPPDPYVNIEANTSVSGVDITLLVNGNLSLLSLDFFSDPPYSREDIVSLLTLGAPRSLLDNRGREVSALGAMMVFSGPLLTRIEDEARDFTGLEVFQIEPTLSDTGGAARLVMGKRLSDRIFVSYSRSLTSTGDEQFSMKYELFDFLYLIGQQDRGSTYSFDLVFSLGGY